MKLTIYSNTMKSLWLFYISADGGNTWTEQWLTDAEAAEHEAQGFIVRAHQIGQRV